MDDVWEFLEVQGLGPSVCTAGVWVSIHGGTLDPQAVRCSQRENAGRFPKKQLSGIPQKPEGDEDWSALGPVHTAAVIPLQMGLCLLPTRATHPLTVVIFVFIVWPLN